MGVPINVAITPPPNPMGDVVLDAGGRFSITGTITPSDPTYAIRAFLIRASDPAVPAEVPAEPANRLELQHDVGSPSQAPGGANTIFNMSVPAGGVPANMRNVSLMLVVIVQDGNDVGGTGMTIRCVTP